MASKRVDEYSTATPADADQAIAIDASDTTDSSAGTVKRFVLSDLFTYVLNKILARVNTWTAAQNLSAGAAIGPDASVSDPSYDALIAIDDQGYTPRTNQVNGVQVNLTLTGAAQGGQLAGLNFYTDSGDSTNGPTTILGVSGAGWHGAPNNATVVRGVDAVAGSYSPNTVTNLIGVDATVYPNATTTTAIGVHVNDVTGAGTNYAVKTEGSAPTSLGGDLTIGATKTANTVWAGPTTGAASAPTWRALVAADIPSLSGVYQPLDSDLTAIAALTTTVFGRALLALADASALRTAAGTVIGTDVQAFDTELSALAGLVSAANKLPYFTGSGTASLADFTAAGRALVDDADASAQRTTLGLGTAAIVDTGTGAANVPTITQADARYQPLDSDLTAIAALSTTAFGRSLLAAADAAALRTLAALGTIATQDANNVSISGGAITGITDLAVADGGTGASTAAAARTNLGLVIGTDVEAHDATLTALAGVTTAADKLIYATGIDAFSTTDLTTTARSLLDDTSTSVMRTTLGLAIGTDVEAHDADLTAIAAISTTGVLQRTGSNTWAAAALIASDIPSLDAAKTTTGTFGAARIVASQALTDQATITWDTSAGAFATVTLAGSRTVAAPTNLTAGASYGIKVTQDGTGSRTLTWNSVFKWEGGVAPLLSTAASSVDVLTFISDGTNLYGGIMRSFS
jgi:hypothetical protein